QRADRARLADALLDEHRQHQLGRGDPGLLHQAAQGRGPAQPAWADVGVRHDVSYRNRSAVGPCTFEPRRCFAGIAASFSRSSTAYSASASTRSGTEACWGCTSTRRPNSVAVSAVLGPITATTVRACGLPAMPTRLRTVEDEVKSTASKPPDLIASRMSAGGGAARTVRYAVTSSTSQPMS